MQILFIYLAVGAGGAVGACLRFFVSQVCINTLGKSFPFGTLAVNLIGSFALGFVFAYFQQQELENPIFKSFLTIGLLGAFTTFSAFSFETLTLLQDGDILKAGINILLNISLCIFSVWLALQFFKG